MAPACRHTRRRRTPAVLFCVLARSLSMVSARWRNNCSVSGQSARFPPMISPLPATLRLVVRVKCVRGEFCRRCLRAYLNYLCILHTFHPNCFQTYYFLDGFPSKTLPATFLSFAARREREKAEWQMYELARTANESTLSLTSAMEMKIR
jgi:hypothetical protein